MARELCGRLANGRTCSDYKCCSVYGHCGTEDEYCYPAACQTDCWSGPSGSNVTAYYHYYHAEIFKYSLTAVGVACAKHDAKKPYAWRSKYGWTAFCRSTGPRGQHACGKWLMVTNPSTNVVVTLRIVDECSEGGLTLDADLFDKLDTDGVGRQKGHLIVDYQFINCDDEISVHPNSKNISSVIDNV